MLATRRLYRYSRWRLRRKALSTIGFMALVALTVQAGPLAWGIAIGLWMIAAGVTERPRARRRLLAWIRAAVARVTRIDPTLLKIVGAEWDDTRLTWAEIDHGGAIRAEEPAVRDRVAEAVRWSLRHLGNHTLAWPPGANTFEITADPPLPRLVSEQAWGQMPGIPIGVTDAATAHGTVDTVDAATGEVLQSLPVLLVNPADSEKHYLVIGGTGAGKSNFTRGFIARALMMGWFPGGVFIFDGKGGSDYIVFERRTGIHCVAREPEEWEQHMSTVSAMMRTRYDEDAEYHRDRRVKPSHPRYLVVLDEVQEIRMVLGRKVVDPFLQSVSRQMRASNGRLMVVTQRPDTEDAIPGAVRDMLEERIILGFVSATGARMALDKDWQQVVDDYGAESVPGRGVARVGGRLARIQSFRLDLPREHPEVGVFYPPKVAESNDEGSVPSAPPTVGRWAPSSSASETTGPIAPNKEASPGPSVVGEPHPDRPAPPPQPDTDGGRRHRTI